MKTCVLDGARLTTAPALCGALASAFRFTGEAAASVPALQQAFRAYRGEPIAIVWRHATLSAEHLGPGFADIVAVLQRAAADGVLTLELA